MAYWDNKINSSSEITLAGDYTAEGRLPAKPNISTIKFYVYLIPKSDMSPTSTTMLGVLSDMDTAVSTPLNSQMWNPTVFVSLTVTEEDLEDYRVFIGAE